MELLRALAPTQLGWPFVILAWLLGLYAFGQLSRRRRELAGEWALLAKLQKDLPKVSASVDSGAWELWRLGIERPRLLARVADAIWAQRGMTSPDLEAIHGMAVEAASTSTSFVRSIPNLAMLLGLMGTVAGLASVVQGLAPQILAAAGASDPRPMAQALAGQLGHLQTAFACTLHGIFVAAAVAFVGGRVEAEQERLLDALREFGLRDLGPGILPRSLEQHLEEFQKKLDSSVNLMGRVTGEMEHASQMLREHLGHLEAATRDAAETLNRVETEFEESARVLSESSGRLDALQREVHNVYTTLVERHDLSEQNFRARAEDLIQRMDLLQDGFNANAREIIEHLQAAAADYSESTGQFREAGIRFGEMSREIGQRAYDAIAERAEQFQSAIVRHEQAALVLEGQLRDLMDRLDPRLLPREEWEAVLAALTEHTSVALALAERLADGRSIPQDGHDSVSKGEMGIEGRPGDRVPESDLSLSPSVPVSPLLTQERPHGEPSRVAEQSQSRAWYEPEEAP
jgi:biopolymer transport protein ExbB/TolQ/polyhydroxyalkanoate synthesis regulator phasin